MKLMSVFRTNVKRKVRTYGMIVTMAIGLLGLIPAWGRQSPNPPSDEQIKDMDLKEATRLLDNARSVLTSSFYAGTADLLSKFEDNFNEIGTYLCKGSHDEGATIDFTRYRNDRIQKLKQQIASKHSEKRQKMEAAMTHLSELMEKINERKKGHEKNVSFPMQGSPYNRRMALLDSGEELFAGNAPEILLQTASNELHIATMELLFLPVSVVEDDAKSIHGGQHLWKATCRGSIKKTRYSSVRDYEDRLVEVYTSVPDLTVSIMQSSVASAEVKTDSGLRNMTQ